MGDSLIDSICKNDIPSVKRFLDSRPDFINSSLICDPPLHYAIGLAGIEMVEMLIEYGADVNVVSQYGAANNGETPLHLAINEEKWEIVQLLIEKGANVNIPDNDGQTPLFYALLEASPGSKLHETYKKIALMLIEAGADINFKNKHGKIPIHAAAQGGDVELFRLLLEKGADYRATEEDRNYSTLTYCRTSGSVEIAKILLELGLEIDHRDKYQFTPLFSAIVDKNFYLAKFLVEMGADVNVRNYHNETPLITASQPSYFHAPIVRMLLENDANVNAANADGTTPLLHLTNIGFEKMTMHIIEDKNNPANSSTIISRKPMSKEAIRQVSGSKNAADLNVQSMKISTNKKGSINVLNQIIDAVINKGANVNAKDKHQFTPLHHAASRGNLHAVQRLVKRGAKQNARDTLFGRTPLSMAVSEGRTEVVRYLLKSGSKPDRQTKGYAQYANEEIQELVRKHGGWFLGGC